MKWSADDERLLKEIYDSTSWDDILEIFPGRTVRSVQVKACKLGIKRGYGLRKTFSGPRSYELTRFFSKVSISDDTDCWTWIGCILHDGYGQFRDDNKDKWRAHRFSFHTFVHEIDNSDQVVHHICENKKCVNPKHLQVMSHADHSKLHNPKKDLR